jgi:ABC-type branched-subunit amino acid transport system substrate-binding protein
MKNYHLLSLVLSILFWSPLQLRAEQQTIGAIIPLTGAVAPWGERVRVGLATANEVQGSPFKIIYEDEGACEAQKALTAYNKLVSIDKVSVIFVSCLSGVEAIAPLAAKDSVLLLSLGLLNEKVLSSGAKLINLATEIGTEAELLSTIVLNERAQQIAGIFFDDAFGQEFSRVIDKQLRDHDASFASREQAHAQLATFKPLILKWKKLKVDLLVTTLAGGQQTILLREMKAIGFKPKIVSTYILECYAPKKAERSAYEGIRFTHPLNNHKSDPELLAFQQELSKHEPPGQPSNINALFAYDGLRLLSRGITQCKSTLPTCLYQYFTKLGKQEGISGEMKFNTNGALYRPYGLKVVKNGEFEWVD